MFLGLSCRETCSIGLPRSLCDSLPYLAVIVQGTFKTVALMALRVLLKEGQKRRRKGERERDRRRERNSERESEMERNLAHLERTS